MSLYFPDSVEITPIVRNISFRSETEGTPFTSNAFVEEESEVKGNNIGSIVDPEIKIFLPASTSISKGDYIKVTKLQGNIILSTSSIGRKRKVVKTFPVGAFKNSHTEVECSSGN